MRAVQVKTRPNPGVGRRVTPKSRIYVHPQGETLLDNLLNRRSRPVDLYRPVVLPAALAALGLPLETPVRWSQRCGCSCGCSPGFIVEGHSGWDVHVTAEG